MNKIIIAIDSFKGSVSSKQAAGSIERGIIKVFPQCNVIKTYIADGGEGTVDALVESLQGKPVTITVHNPLMQPVRAAYGIIDRGKTAVIEMASASGLPLIKETERNPMETTTFGTGEMIRDALSRGCRRFLIGIGGSATNDAGTGMLQALGFRFLDKNGHALGLGGKILSQIEYIDDSNMVSGLRDAEFIVACDVSNPFSGPDGAAYVFAPQKGADPVMTRELDNGLHHFAGIIKRHNGRDIDKYPGAGAAGGMGGGFMALLNASLVSGINMVLDAIRFEELLQGAQLVITGEGKLDAQTGMGKAPRGVLDAAAKYNIPVIAIGGAVEAVQTLNEQGFTAVFSITPAPVSIQKAMEIDFTMENIEHTVSQIMRVIRNLQFS